jgi:exodeoxyribonuclease X
MPPHRAGPDAWVTAHLLVELLRFASIEQMLAWTQEPKVLPTLPLGKHRGLLWSKAPLDYLQWMITKTEMDPDVFGTRSEKSTIARGADRKRLCLRRPQ